MFRCQLLFALPIYYCSLLSFSVILLLLWLSFARGKSTLLIHTKPICYPTSNLPQNFFVTLPMINLTMYRQLLCWDNCLLWWLIIPCFFVLLIHLSTYITYLSCFYTSDANFQKAGSLIFMHVPGQVLTYRTSACNVHCY